MAVGMEELARCQSTGKVRFCGISSHNPEVLRVALASGVCEVVMFPVGPFADRCYVEEILPLARQRGVGTVCFKTFGAGKLLGDTTGYNQPLQPRPRGKLSLRRQTPAGEAQFPRLSVAECLHYTLTLDPDVTLLGMSFPNEQDAVLQAFREFLPLSKEQMDDIRRRAEKAVEGKGECWWNPGAA